MVLFLGCVRVAAAMILLQRVCREDTSDIQSGKAFFIIVFALEEVCMPFRVRFLKLITVRFQDSRDAVGLRVEHIKKISPKSAQQVHAVQRDVGSRQQLLEMFSELITVKIVKHDLCPSIVELKSSWQLILATGIQGQLSILRSNS